jgi:AcrR family transcriptional regulator
MRPVSILGSEPGDARRVDPTAACTYASNARSETLRDYPSKFRLGAKDFRLSTPHFSTRQRILDSAEALFALHGFVGASLRQVTAAANVNLAAVNYHFGSKENLINEVFRRRLDVLNSERLRALAAAESNGGHCLEDVLAAFVEPALAVAQDEHGGGGFVRVLARAYAEHNEQLRKFLHDNYSPTLKRFAAAFARLLPHLDKQELYWRLDIISGALTYAMADFGMIKRRGISEQQHRDLAASHLIKFAASGLRSP